MCLNARMIDIHGIGGYERERLDANAFYLKIKAKKGRPTNISEKVPQHSRN